MELLLNTFSNILSTILPFLFKKREPSEFTSKYEQLRFDVAEALVMFSRCYHNPVDLAKQIDHKLPLEYETASSELRKLGAKASALSATISQKEKKSYVYKENLNAVSSNLIYLSNSLVTPYGCYETSDDQDYATKCEDEIKRILDLQNE